MRSPGASHLSDEWLKERGGAFADTSDGKPEAAAASLHDPVVRLVSVQGLREDGPDLRVGHMTHWGYDTQDETIAAGHMMRVNYWSARSWSW